MHLYGDNRLLRGVFADQTWRGYNILRTKRLEVSTEISMSSPTFVSAVDQDRTVKAPPGVAIGTQVLVVPMPSMAELFNDAARRARFATTRQTVREAMQADTDVPALSNEAVVSLVRRVRQSLRAE